MEAGSKSGRDVRALEHALEGLLTALGDPAVSAGRLRTAWEACAREEEVMLAHLRACREATGEEREQLEQLLRNVARLHGLAVQAAGAQRDAAADALQRARQVLAGLRHAGDPDASGRSCDIAG
jgi:hypothetical protein